jgi:predicted HicB family RNase H-like nuclease
MAVFVGRVLGIIDSITFHGQTVNELELDFRAAIDQYLIDCEATGRQPECAPTGERA